MRTRTVASEFLGTLLLVFFAVGSAVLGAECIGTVGIALTGTSVDPARSLGPAPFAGGEALSRLWLFLVAPLVGGVVAALVHRLTLPAQGQVRLGTV